MWTAEENLQKSAPSFHLVGSGNQTQVTGVGNKHLCLPSHLSNLLLIIWKHSELAPLCFSAPYLIPFCPPNSPFYLYQPLFRSVFLQMTSSKWLNFESRLPYLKRANKNESCCRDREVWRGGGSSEVSGRCGTSSQCRFFFIVRGQRKDVDCPANSEERLPGWERGAEQIHL